MDSARNIIFITCLLSGICYSNARVKGKSFFQIPPSRTPSTIIPGDIVTKLAEELICGDREGWANSFLNKRVPLENPCGKGKCKLIDQDTDYECDCDVGYKFNEEYSQDPNNLDRESRTCVKSKSLVTCKPGSSRVAADQLIVAKFDDITSEFDWVHGVYERKIGLGYHNDDLEIYDPFKNIYQRQPTETHIQKYIHDVPLKGREFYELYDVDTVSGSSTECQKTPNVKATLSYNYEENQWQFIQIDLATKEPKKDAELRLSAKSTKKCVEDITSWTYTYLDATTTTSRINVGTVFINKGTLATKFQIRDKEALERLAESTPSTTPSKLDEIRNLVYPTYPTCETLATPTTPNYLNDLFSKP